MANDDSIKVVSHVARDLLQSAGLFQKDKLVVWEYVSNGLQYIDPGVSPTVIVRLDSRNKRITIKDNGRGMDWQGLQNFFIMHGENIERQEGRPGRGRFGTGKSAAFGIADILRVTTVQNGKESKVELARSAIESLKSGDPIPVRTLEKEATTKDENGTLVEIEGIHLKSLDQKGIIEFIERHLAKWPKDATVYVNNQECELHEPPILKTYSFEPDSDERRMLGDVLLEVNVSKSPLDEDTKGIAIFSKGVWYETTLAGEEGREMHQFIFGEVDVPALDEDESPIAAVDMSRSMRLNPENPLAQAIHAFIGRKVKIVRLELVEDEKKRKATEEAKHLAKEANEIANAINEDFTAFSKKVAKAIARRGGSRDLVKQLEELTGEEMLVPGGDVPAEEVAPEGSPGSDGGSGGNDGPMPDLQPILKEANDGNEKGKKASLSERKIPRGGFSVEYANLGEQNPRAKYVSEERTIYINLDHPQVAAAKSTVGIDDIGFKRLSYEIAFVEYAIALAQELAARDEYIDLTDPIYDIRETINRVAAKSALLYK